ncbi:xyloside xylosyltransferase 1 isoform X2 [Larus michahellis]|uniref:xyloside xylosyltransferase 1 isoform X2 n=1 Tax=Larus michahellis TaxID=119627 RepID=UPI003D9B6B08
MSSRCWRIAAACPALPSSWPRLPVLVRSASKRVSSSKEFTGPGMFIASTVLQAPYFYGFIQWLLASLPCLVRERLCILLLRVPRCSGSCSAFRDPAAFQGHPVTAVALGLACHLVSLHFFLTWLLSSLAAVPEGDPTDCPCFWRCGHMGRIHVLISKASGYCAAGVAGLQPLEHLRHTFWQYRRENPQTKVGDPPPDGLPGFNSGVLLLNLEAMRQSKLYNQLLEPAMVQKLTEKYHFKGHLGDQDFFTMVGMEHPELFHVLDCTWNRQLCTWWRDHGYSDVFDQYFQCEGEVKIYHGNCNTPIPED